MSTKTHDTPGHEVACDGCTGASSLAPCETGALIDYILTQFHEVHRQDLAGLVPLAGKVEEANPARPEMPVGLSALLAEIAAELEDHMQKEEIILFPMMRADARHMTGGPIARMREEHDSHTLRLHELKQLTNGGRLPEDADAAWQALYGGVLKLINDLEMHIQVENGVLFPRFDQ